MADETKTWQEKADAFKTLLQPNGIYAQIVYQSDSHHDCEPIPIPYKLDGDQYPFVVEAPTGMNHPKFDWSVDNHGWHETDANAQGERIAALETTAQQTTEQVKALQEAHETTVQSSKTLDSKMDNMTKLLVQSNANQAKLMAVVNSLTQKSTGTTDSTDKGGDK
ncbi:MAG: hypothetical protein LKE17_00040 [Lactobacillus sp.]|jgi:hypothetical protein|nr:hypothetical protein [Lactobacillus sp.]